MNFCWQMGAALVEKIMDTFLTLFTESQLQSLMLMEGSGVRVVEKFLFILQVHIDTTWFLRLIQNNIYITKTQALR